MSYSIYVLYTRLYSMLKVKLDKHKREKTRGKRDAEVALYKAVGHFYRGYRARQIFRCVYIYMRVCVCEHVIL